MNEPHDASLSKKLILGTHYNIQAKRAVPAEYHVHISPQLDTKGMIEQIETMAHWARMTHQALARSEAHENIKATTSFNGFANLLNKTRGKLRGRGFRPEDYGNLDDDGILEMKRSFAEALGNNLTKLNWAFNGPHNRDLWDRNGVMRNWAAGDCLDLMRTSRTTIEMWAKMLAWERKRYGRKAKIDDTMDAYDRVIDGTAVGD